MFRKKCVFFERRGPGVFLNPKHPEPLDFTKLDRSHANVDRFDRISARNMLPSGKLT